MHKENPATKRGLSLVPSFHLRGPGVLEITIAADFIAEIFAGFCADVAKVYELLGARFPITPKGVGIASRFSINSFNNSISNVASYAAAFAVGEFKNRSGCPARCQLWVYSSGIGFADLKGSSSTGMIANAM
jgi:hypothetical protein